MPACETCGHDFPAFQSKMEKRIAEQGERIRETTAMLSEAKARATELEGRATELDAKVKELSAREEQVSIREAESAGGWALDDRGRKLARWAYEDSTEGVDAAEKPSFADWLWSETATNDPVLSSYRNQVAAPKAQGQTAPATGARPPTPPVNGSTQPPVRRTLDQINAEVRAVMSSGLPPSEKSAKLAELKGQRDQAGKGPAA